MTHDESVCYHEAGHATAGVVSGLTVSSLWMYDPRTKGGCCYFTKLLETLGPEKAAIVRLAGEAAEKVGAKREAARVVKQNPPLAAYLAPASEARGRARERAGLDYEDVALRYDPDDVVGAARIHLAQIAAEELIEKHWQTVRLVAQMLENYGAMTGEHVTQVIRERLLI